MRTAALAASVVTLAIAGCRGSEEATSESSQTATPATTAVSPIRPEPPNTAQVLRLMRSCEIKEIIFLHSDRAYVTFRGGERVFVLRPDRTALANAAEAVSAEGGCNIIIGIE